MVVDIDSGAGCPPRPVGGHRRHGTADLCTDPLHICWTPPMNAPGHGYTRRHAAVLLLAFVAIWLASYFVPAPSLRLQVHSNTPGITQLYTPSTDGSVVEANSLSFTLAEGRSGVD